MVAPQQFAQVLDGVRARVGAEHADLTGRVEGGQRLRPAVVQRGPDRQRPRVERHDRHDPTRGGAAAQGTEHRLGPVEIHQHAMAQHHVEPLAAEHLDRAFAGAFDQSDSAPHRLGFGPQALVGLGQHRRGRIEQRHLKAQPGERQRLVGRAAADVEHRGRGPAGVRQQVLMQHEGADPTLDRGVCPLDELLSQGGPRVIGHGGHHLTATGPLRRVQVAIDGGGGLGQHVELVSQPHRELVLGLA